MLMFKSVMISYQFIYWVVSMADAVAWLIIAVLCAVAFN